MGGGTGLCAGADGGRAKAMRIGWAAHRTAAIGRMSDRKAEIH